MDLWQVLAGLAVGFVVGLTGVGGGALMTPLLHLGFGIPLPVAVGTDLFYAAITKASGAVIHARNGVVDWGIVKRLAMGSIPAAIATVGVIRVLNLDEKSFADIISVTLSLALCLTAVFLLARRRLVAWALVADRLSGLRRVLKEYRRGLTVVGGVFLGVLVTLTSVGSGVLGTALILFLFPSMATVSVVGTELAHAVPLVFVAGLGHLSLGTVDGWLLISLVVGSLPGVYAGSVLASRISDGVLRPALATMLVAISVMLIWPWSGTTGKNDAGVAGDHSAIVSRLLADN
jgi:uncharacterized membrane protein YfcA